MTDREIMQMSLKELEKLCNTFSYPPDSLYDIINALRARLLNEFNPDWDAMSAMVEEQQRMAKRIEELEAALAQPEQEPVAWKMKGVPAFATSRPNDTDSIKWDALYTAPPQREVYCGCGDEIVAGDGARCGTCVAVKYKERVWVGLTEKEIIRLRHLYDPTAHWSLDMFARAIEAKLKEKNYD